MFQPTKHTIILTSPNQIISTLPNIYNIYLIKQTTFILRNFNLTKQIVLPYQTYNILPYIFLFFTSLNMQLLTIHIQTGHHFPSRFSYGLNQRSVSYTHIYLHAHRSEFNRQKEITDHTQHAYDARVFRQC